LKGKDPDAKRKYGHVTTLFLLNKEGMWVKTDSGRRFQKWLWPAAGFTFAQQQTHGVIRTKLIFKHECNVV
jgi:hypothetical protein